jgi:hypothetical protein
MPGPSLEPLFPPKNSMSELLSSISLQGLEIAPSQRWGAVRLVPLIRRQSRQDLTLTKRSYQENPVVAVDRATYYAYIPHGLVLHWSDRGEPVVAEGSQLGRPAAKWRSETVLKKMARREDKNSLRFLPLHLAMESFIALFMKVPQIAWPEYSRRSLREGFGSHTEYAIGGQSIMDLSEAFRVFEIHEQQVGVLLFVGEALASAFILPNPQDYRALHDTLLQDFYGETFYYYGLYGQAPALQMEIDTNQVNSLADLQTALQQLRRDWAAAHTMMAGELIDRPIQAERVYQAGPFSLQRFITDLDRIQTNYIGKAIVDDRGSLQYLKIYGLSAAQTRRTYLIQQLSAQGWQLENTAIALNTTPSELLKRIEKAGLSYLFSNQLLEQQRKSERL